MKDNEYKCAMCGGVFEKEIPDEQAKKEAEDIFDAPVDDSWAVVCDDCWHKMLAGGGVV